MIERITYPLKFPIETFEGEERKLITSLNLAPRVKGRHMKATDKAGGPVEAKLLLIGALAGVPRVVTDELDEDDVLSIDALYAGETPDLAAIAGQLGLPETAPLATVMDAIGTLQRRSLSVPLDGGAGTSADGLTTGARS